MPSLPVGTVTLVFTDIEGSTALLRQLGPDAYAAALQSHCEMLRHAFVPHGGVEVKTVGDAFFFAFPRATAALAAALAGQLRLADTVIRVRMGVHTGEPVLAAGDYVGIDVHKAARVAAAAHGGQVLVTEQTAALSRTDQLLDLGLHRLKDLTAPERLYQLRAPELRAVFPPLRTLDAHAHNLPLQPTPLIGRESELHELATWLEGDRVRALTLTGPGGTGKTRLALQAAANSVEAFSGGAFFVNLSQVRETAAVLPAIAQSLGAREEPGRSLAQVIGVCIAGRKTLVLLDNLEQVIEAAPDIAALLAATPSLHVLATSRIPLRIRGEQEFPVRPLSAPRNEERHSGERLVHYPAVQLFVERAQAVRPGFRADAANVEAIAEICRRLDGLPLAIELAAARSRILDPETMLERLDKRLNLLTGGYRDLPLRQRTLRNTIQWSHDLLGFEERVVFRRISAFAGEITIAAIQRICDLGDLSGDLLDTIDSLVEKNLVRRLDGAVEPTMSLLETIRDFAREQLLESSEFEKISERHAAHFLAIAEEARPKLVGGEQRKWSELLDSVYQDLRAAHRWLVSREDFDRATRLAASLQTFWIARGQLQEGRDWLEESLASPRGCEPEIRTVAMSGLAALARQQGDLNAAESVLDECLTIARQHGLDRSAAVALLNLAAVYGLREDLDRSDHCLEESLQLLERMNEPRLSAMAATNLGVNADRRGDLAHARELWEKAIPLYEAVGDLRNAAVTRSNLGHLAFDQGNLEEATRRFRESLEIISRAGDVYYTVYEIANLAMVAAASGSFERSVALFSLAEQRFERMGAQAPAFDREKYDRALASARAAVSPATWNRAWAEGAAMSLEQAVDYALANALS